VSDHASYRTEKTNQRVPNVGPALVTRFRGRAERRCRRLNARRRVEFYRWEVVALDPMPRWAVVAMQNMAVPM
jgi:hypothetical protein